VELPKDSVQHLVVSSSDLFLASFFGVAWSFRILEVEVGCAALAMPFH